MEMGSLEGKGALYQGLMQTWPPPRGRGLSRIDLDSLGASLPPPPASMVSQIWRRKVSSKASWGRKSGFDQLDGLASGSSSSTPTYEASVWEGSSFPVFTENSKGIPPHFSQSSPCPSVSPAWGALLSGPQ